MLVNILIFIAVLSVLVIVHELGHFIAAKRAGVGVEEFGFGIPPRLFGKKIKGTLFSLNLLPFGGFVKLHGENFEEDIQNPNKAFLNKNKLTRTKILTAGVLMNFLLGILAFAIVYTFSGVSKETKNVRILEVATSSPAQVAGIVVGDVVRQVDKVTISSVGEFTKAIDAKKGKRVTLLIERTINEKTEEKKISLIPRENPPEDEGSLGVVISNFEVYYPPVWQRPFLGIYYGVKEAIYWGGMVLSGFVKIFTDLFAGHAPKDLAGPVGIFAITSQAAKVGILALINFVGILSINLGVVNILPFPALDGGRLLFVLIEKVFGRKVVPKVEAIIHTVGMGILILALLVVTFSDIRRLITAGSLSGFIDSMVK